VEQSLYKLEVKETGVAKTDFNPTVVKTANILIVESLSLVVHLLSLIDLFFYLTLSSLNCLTCFFIILLSFFYSIFKVVFRFLSSLYIAYPLDFIL